MIERQGLIKFAGKDATIIGADLTVGQKAPEFKVRAQDWSMIAALKATQGKVRVIAAVPSLDTSVCDRETRRFNEEAAHLSKDITILVVSTDLPFAQKRWCGATGIDQITVVSDHFTTDFGKKYGCLIKEGRILRRAIFIVNRKNILTYVAYMPALGEEPNYDEVLQAARAALAAG